MTHIKKIKQGNLLDYIESKTKKPIPIKNNKPPKVSVLPTRTVIKSTLNIIE